MVSEVQSSVQCAVKCSKSFKQSRGQSVKPSKQRTKKQQIHATMQDSSTEEYPLTVGSELANSVDSQKLNAKMLIKGNNVNFLLDSGATVNVLPESVYRRVCEDPELNGLEVPQGTKLSPLGRKRISVRNPQNNKKYRFQKFRLLVRKTNHCLLLGASAIQGMHLITVNAQNILTAESSSDKGLTLTQVVRSNTKMFWGENVCWKTSYIFMWIRM